MQRRRTTVDPSSFLFSMEKSIKDNYLILEGSEGGFCYPQRDRGIERKRTGCECFKDVPPMLRRRKRSYNHVIVNGSGNSR
ncbi:hypothetical protein Q1695_013526 [Nippostrongylus brasiliensis]|nr:hypothetical protein Q1695_013526 [Nippostrongylus brasiliensis]